MASQEHLQILKEGVEVWNQWRKDHPQVQVDLRKADLSGASLSNMDFGGSRLNIEDFRASNPIGADFWEANLSGADLSGADFFNAGFGGANLNEAILRSARLLATRFRGTELREADFTGATVGYTIFARTDLSETRGLETVIHEGPSDISVSTIYRSKGHIPEAFLRGSGVPDSLMLLMKALTATMSPIEFYSCFISYSSKDQKFATRLHADLQRKGVRCWFAPEDLKIGDKLRPSFDEAIRLHDKLMVILTENSVESTWVEKEVETAFEKERQQNRVVLFPIRLDDAVMKTQQPWAADIRRTRHIGDFHGWKGHDSYKKAFDRLLRDLKAENKTASSTPAQ